MSQVTTREVGAVPATLNEMGGTQMNRLRWFTAALAVAAMLAGGVALAQGPRGGGPGGPGGFGGRGGRGPMMGMGLALNQLDLTDAQKEQIRQIRSQHEQPMRDAMSRLESARQAQQKAIEAIPADESKITSLTQDMVQSEVDVAIQSARLNTDIWSVLTTEQQAKVKQLRAERESRLEQRGSGPRRQRQGQ